MPIPTAAFIGLTILAALIGLDVFLAVDKIRGNTWSEILRMWSHKTTFIGWVYGVLAGHFFHPAAIKHPVMGQPSSLALLLWCTAFVVVGGMASAHNGFPMPPWAVLVPAFVAGAFLWPVQMYKSGM